MPLYSLYFRFFVLSVVLLFTVTAVALDYSPFYLNASWTNTISSLTTIVDSVFDENINVVYIVDSQFKAYRLNYHTLSSPVTKDWSSVVDSGMRPWSHERITKNAAQSVNPYSPEVFLATYCYDSNGKSIIRVHRFDQNLNQISSIPYSSVAFVSDFFDGQYRNPRLKLYFESASTLHVALFHDGSRGRNAWLAKIKIAYGSSPSISKLDDKTLPDAAVAIDFGCNSGFVCIWTTTRTVTPYSLADYSKGSSVTIAASSNEINYDPAMERYGNVTLYFHRQINDTTKLILHSKNTSFNSLAANTLPYKYDFPVQLNTAIQISQLGVACVGFTSNNIDSSPGRSYDIIILRYNASFYRASTTIISTTKQDNLTLLIPRTTSDTFSVVGTTDGSIDEPDVTASKPRVIFLAHFQPFNISSVQPALVAPGQAITIQFSQLPLNAISMGFPRVVYNGQQCTGVAWNSSTLRANVGSGVGGPYELSVTFDYLPFKPSVVADSMLAFQDPVILNISPSVGPASGFPINITMDPIGNVTQPLVVSIGGRPCANVVQTSSNSLRCNVGPGTGQNHSVVVRIGASQSNGSAFISYNAPVLSQVVPSVGPAAGSNEVNLTGTNFGTCSSTIPCSAAPNSWVTIGGQNCTNLTLFSDNRMRCVAPRGTGTNRTIRLSINGQESNEVLYSYERPSISVLVPRTSVQPDPTIYIEGFNFGFEPSNIFVTFADTNTSMEYNCTSFVLSSDSSIRCYFANNTLPLFATFDVTIIVSGQKSLSSSSNKFYSGIPNNPPIAYPFNTSVNEDQSIVVQLEGSDPDAADAVKIYAVSTPQYGNLYYYLATSVDPKGPLIDTTLWPVELPLGRAIYFPPADYNGEDSFNFVVRDTYNEESTIAFANISVLPVSDPPVPIPFNSNTTEDSDLLLNFTVSDPDSPGTAISIIIVTLPSAGRIFEVDNNYAPITEITIVPFQLSNFTKAVMYKPPLNAAGTVNGLSFKARDETANSLNAAQVSILITPINDAPIAFNKTYSIAEDSATTISFDCQDVDMQDSLVVTVLSVPPPEAGILLNPGLKYRAPVYANDPVPASLTLELAKNYYGQFSIGYMCSDSSLSSEIAYIDVEVTNVNDAPMASSGIVLTDEDTDVLCQLNVSDVETPDQISITILDLPRQGMLLAQINDTDPLNDTWSVLTSDLIPWTIPFYRKNLTFRPTADTHGDPYATFTFRADDDVDKSNFATINVIVNSVNDPPTINLTSLDISAYEDQEVVITLDIKDVDMNDRLVVKITDIFVNGTLFHFDRRTNSRTQLTIGEGSEISGPPYVIVFRPSQNFYSETVESLQKFNVTFTDATGAGSSHLVNFSVLPVNDVPIINCASDSIDLPFNFVNGSDEKFNFTIGVTDVDDANVTLMLVNAPRLGYLSADGKTLKGGSRFTTTQLFFYANNSGGGYPYSNFSVYAVDAAGAVSSTCTFQFTFTCPPRLYNNIFSGGKGPICTDCPVGSFCSQDGKHSPYPNYGWWENTEINAFVPCIPPDACPGSQIRCAVGYEGPRCGKCASGFYRISGSCKSCDTALPDWVVPVGTLGAFVLICAMSLLLKGGPSEGLLNILLNFIQTVALFDQLHFDFSPSLKNLVQGFNGIGYLNIELAAPECMLSKYQLAGTLDYRFKFTVMAWLPLILLGIVSTFVILNTYPFQSVLWRVQKFLGRREFVSSELLYHHQNKMFVSCIQAYNTLLGMIYIILVNQSIAIFDCSLEPDGQYWMDEQPDSLCYQGWWSDYANLAYVVVVFYIIGIPLYFSVLIFLYYQTTFVGGRWLRAREHAGRMLNVRNSYFRSSHQFFIVIQLIRKLFIVIVKMFLTKYLILQAVLTSVILSVDAVLSAKYLPYIFQSLNALEVVCTLSAIVIMNGALLIHTNQFKEVSQKDAAAAIIATLIISCVTISIFMVVIEVATRIKRWREARQDSTVFDEKILASTQVGGTISRIRLGNTTFLRKVFGLTVGGPMEQSSLKAKPSIKR